MTHRETIIEALEFIESRLTSEITISDIAQKGYYSLYHFIRLFSSITGVSPRKYLVHRRLTESVQRLLNTSEKVVDIAFDFQFASHEVFTRTFRKYFGTTPSRVRKGESISSDLLLKPITENYLYQSQKARDRQPELLELGKKIIVGVSFFVKNLDKLDDLTREWNDFIREVTSITSRQIPECYYQVQFWTESQEVEGMNFFLGVEVKDINHISPQFVVKIIPEGSYLRFIHKGLSKNVGYTYRYVYTEFLPDTNYKLTQPFNFEYYGENYLSPCDENSESFIYIPVEK